MADKKKILVVDDEPDMVEWLTTFFQDNGFETIFAHNGFDGYEKVKSDKPDLITLDITMDKESGIKMYRKIHEDETTKNIPVVMLTGVSAEFKKFISTRSQVPPPSAYFEKPVDREALLAKVRELLG